MKAVGIREMKNRLSELVRAANRGETIVVTDRGRAVAELRQVDPHRLEAAAEPGLLDLARQGLLTLGQPRRRHVHKKLTPLPGSLSSAELLDLERGER